MTTLFPYQQEGAAFLSERQHALLADPMGLGKSAQAIAACDLTGAKTILVLCPASVRATWVREIERFSLGTPVALHYSKPSIVRNHANIVSYDGATKYKDILMQHKYDVLILDEAHFLKSPSAKRTQAVYGYRGQQGLAHRAARVWCLSGTPAPNNPAELYPMCRVLFSDGFKDKYGKVMNRNVFTDRFCVTVNNGFAAKVVGGKNLEELKKRLAPYTIRRKKEDVLKELPPVRFDSLYLAADCLALPEEEERKVREALEQPDPLRALEAAAPHIANLRRVMGLAKVEALVEWVKDQLESDLDKLVIFAHHRDVLYNLRGRLSPLSQIAYIDGQTPAAARDNQVQLFQTRPEYRIFIGQLQAAGTGLTLTAASNLIFAEYSWVPAENEQAAMRIHRIGQNNACLVRYAVVAGSLDERIAAVVRRKSAVISQVFV